MAAFIDIVLVADNGYASSLTRTQNVSMINHIYPASAADIANFPTALSKIIVNTIQYNQNAVKTLLSSATVAALKTAIAA